MALEGITATELLYMLLSQAGEDVDSISEWVSDAGYGDFTVSVSVDGADTLYLDTSPRKRDEDRDEDDSDGCATRSSWRTWTDGPDDSRRVRLQITVTETELSE